MTSFLLSPQSGWRSFKLQRDGDELTRDFDSIADALDHARTLPNSAGADFLVLDDKGRDMAMLTV